MIRRRGLLRGLIGALAAPAIIRTPGLLMPIKPLPLPLPLMALIGESDGTYFWEGADGSLRGTDRLDGPFIPIEARVWDADEVERIVRSAKMEADRLRMEIIQAMFRPTGPVFING